MYDNRELVQAVLRAGTVFNLALAITTSCERSASAEPDVLERSYREKLRVVINRNKTFRFGFSVCIWDQR